MFRFTIRDVLWLMVVVAMGAAWQYDRRIAEQEKRATLKERDAAIANERRLAELKARELAGQLIDYPTPARPRTRRAEPTRAPITD